MVFNSRYKTNTITVTKSQKDKIIINAIAQKLVQIDDVLAKQLESVAAVKNKLCNNQEEAATSCTLLTRRRASVLKVGMPCE